MAIDWDRFKFLAEDGYTAIWTYPTETVGTDMHAIERRLPKRPARELIPADHGISVWFKTSFLYSLEVINVCKALDGIAEEVLRE